MNIKKLHPATIFFAAAMIVYLAATLLCCYTTKPKIAQGEFPFSITYEYQGETGTLSGVLKCEYSGSYTILGEHHRYWKEEVIYDNPENLEEPFVIEQNDEKQTTLYLHENMYAGYFMGDPLYEDHYEAYGLEGAEPHVAYYDYKNDIILDEENEEEILESIGFKIVDYTYAEPIENSFSFSGIKYEADNIILFVAISLVFFLVCLIFVRRDEAYQYTKLDKTGIVLNFLLSIVAVPVISFICMLFGLVESDIAIIDQIIYNIPPVVILCLALSVVFRRKGFSKTGFFIQFGGIVPFVLVLVLEMLFQLH